MIDTKKDNKFWEMMNLVPKQLPAPEPKLNEISGKDFFGPGPRGMEGFFAEGFFADDFLKNIPDIFKGRYMPVPKGPPKSPNLQKFRDEYERRVREEEKKEGKFAGEIRVAYLCKGSKKASAMYKIDGKGWDETELKHFIEGYIDFKPFSWLENNGATRGYWVTADSFKKEPFPHLEGKAVFRVIQQAWEPIGSHWVYTVICQDIGA